MGDYGHLLQELVTHFGGSKQDLARAVRITPFAFSRLKRKAPDLETALRLAHVTGTSASRVLRGFGLTDINDIIEELYGPPAKFQRRRLDMTPVDEKHLKSWRALRTPERKAFDLLIAKVLSGDVAITRTPRTSPPRTA